MDFEERSEGHWHFRLGPVEKWVVATGAFLLISGCGWFVNTVTGQLTELSKAQSAQATQLALANQQLSTLTLQLADVPGLSRQVAEMKVQLDRNTEDVKELRGTRGLR